MLKSTKTVAIFCIILIVVVVAGFTLVLMRKQSVDLDSGQITSRLFKPKTTTPDTEDPAA